MLRGQTPLPCSLAALLGCNLPTANQKSDNFQIYLGQTTKTVGSCVKDDALGSFGGWGSRYDPGIY